MGTKEDIINVARPIASLIAGGIMGYMWWMEQETDDMVIPLVLGLFTAIVVYVMTTEKKANTDIISTVRIIIGIIFGLAVAYGVYVYIDDLTYGVIAAVVAIPISVFLMSNLEKGGE
ncbi:hypothetical protein J7J90_00360 [Candidatus Micrarchaeota archaeon]|nr:hypothetical protein [Candidatus Micrarchaeota archaeon]